MFNEIEALKENLELASLTAKVFYSSISYKYRKTQEGNNYLFKGKHFFRDTNFKKVFEIKLLFMHLANSFSKKI